MRWEKVSNKSKTTWAPPLYLSKFQCFSFEEVILGNLFTLTLLARTKSSGVFNGVYISPYTDESGVTTIIK